MNDDTISRQAAIDSLEEPCKVPDTWTDEYAVGERAQWEKDVKALNNLPFAERRGQWIAVDNDVDYYPFMCSECYETVIKRTNYCPRCGARMDETVQIAETMKGE